VAVLGTDVHYWARLASLRIVAEIPDSEGFWASAASVRARIDDALDREGIRAIVSVPRYWAELPARPAEFGFSRLGETDYLIHEVAEITERSEEDL
jgi:hypothetical protein